MMMVLMLMTMLLLIFKKQFARPAETLRFVLSIVVLGTVDDRGRCCWRGPCAGPGLEGAKSQSRRFGFLPGSSGAEERDEHGDRGDRRAMTVRARPRRARRSRHAGGSLNAGPVYRGTRARALAQGELPVVQGGDPLGTVALAQEVAARDATAPSQAHEAAARLAVYAR